MVLLSWLTYIRVPGHLMLIQKQLSQVLTRKPKMTFLKVSVLHNKYKSTEGQNCHSIFMFPEQILFYTRPRIQYFPLSNIPFHDTRREQRTEVLLCMLVPLSGRCFVISVAIHARHVWHLKCWYKPMSSYIAGSSVMQNSLSTILTKSRRLLVLLST